MGSSAEAIAEAHMPGWRAVDANARLRDPRLKFFGVEVADQMERMDRARTERAYALGEAVYVLMEPMDGPPMAGRKVVVVMDGHVIGMQG